MAHAGMDDSGIVRATVLVHGFVQGVGFRWYTRAKAEELGLTGSAENLRDGSVRVVAEGPRPAVEALIRWLRSGDTPGSVENVVEEVGSPGFDSTRFDVG